jgi:hypothetical protein
LKRALLVTIAFLLIVPSAFAAPQKSKTSAKRRPRTVTPAATDSRNEGANRVANQIKYLTKFLYLYGPIARDIQSVDTAIRNGEASQTAKDQAAKNKQSIRSSLVNIRDGLDQLEVDFRTNPALQPFYIRLAGSAAGAASAEQAAEAGQYEQSGRELLNVVNRLTDVLLAMRQS